MRAMRWAAPHGDVYANFRERPALPDDDGVFYLFLQKQIGAELHIYLEEGTYHKRLFGGLSTNDMKK
jgi:hypothetical protein